MKTREERRLKGKLESLDRVMGEVRQTVQTMGGIHLSAQTSNSSAVLKSIEDLRAQAAHLEALAKSVRDDYETVRAETALQREVTLRLFAHTTSLSTPLDTWRRLEESIRRQVISEGLEEHDG